MSYFCALLAIAARTVVSGDSNAVSLEA